MRIVSLLPSAAEIVCALGLDGELVGVTHECDYPSVARSLPAVTASALDGLHDSATIDRLVAGSIHDHGGIYTLDWELLRELQPDLILTQELCDVCAVSYTEVQRAAPILPGSVPLGALEPRTLGDILDRSCWWAASPDAMLQPRRTWQVCAHGSTRWPLVRLQRQPAHVSTAWSGLTAEYVQRLLGYGLTGLTQEHVMPVFWGEGRNGKDTIIETLGKVLGSGIASPVSRDVFLGGKHDQEGPQWGR